MDGRASRLAARQAMTSRTSGSRKAPERNVAHLGLTSRGSDTSRTSGSRKPRERNVAHLRLSGAEGAKATHGGFEQGRAARDGLSSTTSSTSPRSSSRPHQPKRCLARDAPRETFRRARPESVRMAACAAGAPSRSIDVRCRNRAAGRAPLRFDAMSIWPLPLFSFRSLPIPSDHRLASVDGTDPSGSRRSESDIPACVDVARPIAPAWRRGPWPVDRVVSRSDGLDEAVAQESILGNLVAERQSRAACGSSARQLPGKVSSATWSRSAAELPTSSASAPLER